MSQTANCNVKDLAWATIYRCLAQSSIADPRKRLALWSISGSRTASHRVNGNGRFSIRAKISEYQYSRGNTISPLGFSCH